MSKLFSSLALLLAVMSSMVTPMINGSVLMRTNPFTNLKGQSPNTSMATNPATRIFQINLNVDATTSEATVVVNKSIDPRFHIKTANGSAIVPEICTQSSVAQYMSACLVISLDKWQINVTEVSATAGVDAECDRTIHADCAGRMCCAFADVIDCQRRLSHHICPQEVMDDMNATLSANWPVVCDTNRSAEECGQSTASMDHSLDSVMPGPLDTSKDPKVRLSVNMMRNINIQVNSGHSTVASVVTVVCGLVVAAALIVY